MDVDTVEDTFDPGELGNFELENWVGELIPPLLAWVLVNLALFA